MHINLYSFKKKYNSTKSPNGSGRTFDCTLVENTSLLSPSVRLKAPSDLIGKVKEPVTPGSLITISDNNALLDEPLPTLQAGILYDGSSKSSLTLFKSGKNLCGGSQLLENAKIHLPEGITDLTNKTFTFSLNNTAVLDVGGFCGSIYDKFKENTVYTIFIAFAKSGSNGTTNIRVYYSDGTYTAISLSVVTPGEKNTILFTTPSNKTLAGLRKYSGSGTTTLYYDECGIFEGTITAEQFEAYRAEKITVNFPEPIYGGYYNTDTGILSVTKDSTGSDLPTPYPMYQCTPHDIYLNSDVNNIWCNTGAIESCYYWKYQAGAGRMYQYNYAFIPDMDRYYWIKDIRYELGTWVFDLSIDVLASWKNTIGSSSEYVLRAASEKDTNVIDTFYPTKNHIDAETQEATFSLYGGNGLSLNPCYLLSVVGPNHQADAVDHKTSMLASTTYYVLSEGDLELLCYAMMDNVNVFDIQTSELSYALQKQLINPYQYLVDCKLIPWTPDLVRDAGSPNPTPRTVSLIPLGFNQLEINGSWYISRIPTVGLATTDAAGLVSHFSNTIHVTKNPLTSTIGNWVNHSPFSRYSIFVEPFGEIPIPDEITMLSDAPAYGDINTFPIVFDVTCDAVEGTVRLELQSYNVNAGQTIDYIPFYTNTVKVGCSIPLFRTQQNITGSAGALAGAGLSAVGGALAGGLGILGGAFKGAASIMSGTDSAMPSLVSNGSMGSLMDNFANLARPRIVKKFASFVDFNNADNGSPLCKIKTIHNLSGFIKCQDAHFASAGTEDENRMVTDYLNGGFFYE